MWIESANCGKAISCSRTTNMPMQGTLRTIAVNGPKEAVHFTLSLRWKARPAVSGDGTQWASLAQASSQARGILEGARESAEISRSMLVHELTKVDSAMDDTQRGFDETVLMVMLHFQNLHQVSTWLKPIQESFSKSSHLLYIVHTLSRLIQMFAVVRSRSCKRSDRFPRS